MVRKWSESVTGRADMAGLWVDAPVAELEEVELHGEDKVRWCFCSRLSRHMLTCFKHP